MERGRRAELRTMRIEPQSSSASDPAPSVGVAAARTRPRRIGPWYAFAALVLGFLLAQLFGKLAGDVARSLLHASADAPTVIVISLWASELALVGIALLMPLLAAKPIVPVLDLRPARRLRVYIWAGAGTVLLGPLGDRLMSAFAQLFPKLSLGVVEQLHDLAQRLPLAVLWPSFALLPGLAEELLFRGVLQGAFRDPRWAIAVSGGVFALFHVDPVHVIGVLPLGLFLAFTAQRSSTLVTIIAHVINNSVALIGIRNSALDVGYGAEQPMPWSWLALSLVAFACMLALLIRDTRARPS
jgi:membrane protease YdiL (CAAX protease family)